MDQQQASFSGWAVVELMGHQKEVGFVTTQYFGGAALLQIDVPELPEREVELKRGGYHGGRFLPTGAKVKRGAVAGRTRLVSPNAIYALNPCTEDVARTVLEDSTPREIALVSLPEGRSYQRRSASWTPKKKKRNSSRNSRVPSGRHRRKDHAD